MTSITPKLLVEDYRVYVRYVLCTAAVLIESGLGDKIPARLDRQGDDAITFPRSITTKTLRMTPL